MNFRQLPTLCALINLALLTPLSAAEPTPETEWLFVDESQDPGLSDPLVVEGMVMVGSEAGTVYAFDVKTGQEIWRHSHGAGVYDRPEFLGERVYILSDEKGVEALNRRDGSPVWSYPPRQRGGFGTLTVAPTAKLVFLGGYDGMVRALDADTGVEQWATSIIDDAPADPPGFDGKRARFQEIVARPTGAICDGQWVFFSVFDQSRVVAFDIASGRKTFDYQTGGWVLQAPLIDGEHVFIGSQDKSLHCVERATGHVLWSFRTQSRIESSAAVDNGRVYFGSCDGGFYCVNRVSGEEIWTFQVETEGKRTTAIYSDPLIMDGTVCFAAGEGQVYALDLASGALRWKHRPSEDSELFTSPASDGRYVFVSSRPTLDKAGKAALLAIDPYFGQ
jgi:outer membrane protein assembly factor BamB